MSKISKLLVMALVVLAVITMSLSVNAGTASLVNYIKEPHNINGMIFELTNKQKTAVTNYINSNVSDAQADVALGKIKEAESLVASTHANRLDKLSADVKTKIISLAKEAANAVGLTLTVNTADNTFTVSSANEVLASGKAESFVSYQQAGGATAGQAAGAAAPAATTGKTLLYTGANYAVYAVVALAIVAVAVVVKKRA